VVITSDQSIRGGRLIELKKTVDAAVAKCPSVRRVLVARRTGNPVPIMEGRDVWLEEVNLVYFQII
jgi:acetyl-CoA synthetase